MEPPTKRSVGGFSLYLFIFSGCLKLACRVRVYTKRSIMGAQHMRLIQMLLKDESGATAIEYGLIAAGISVAIIAVVQGLGTKLNSTFTSVSNALN